MVSTSVNSDALFLEMGKALFVFQSIEARIKVVLPHLSVPGTGEPPPGEGWEGRNKYLESKEMLGHLVKFLQQRMQVDDPEGLELEWRAVVQGRNEVMHQFFQQSFARCENPEQLNDAIEFLRSRKARALPLLQMLDLLLRGFLAALALPPEYEGEFSFEQLTGSGESAA